MVGRVRLALDHNFPETILRDLGKHLTDVELVSLRDIDQRLPNLEDRPLLIALRQLGWKGLVTNNYRMLKNPFELAAIIATKITLFAVEGVGDDPIRATGAVLLDLPGALKRMDSRRGQVFWLRPRDPRPENPRDLFTKLAVQRKTTYDGLMSDVAVSRSELRTRVLR